MQHDEKNELKPWLVKEWCISEASAEFVAKMEDVLEAYQRPFDPLRSVVCIDEMNRQLVEETRIPCEAGWPEKVDSEYVRKGVMDVTVKTSPRLEAFLNLKKMRSKASPPPCRALGNIWNLLF